MTSTLLNNNSLYNDESQLIAKVITTPYERVLQILSKIRLFLVDILSTFKPISSELSSNIINDLDWVVSKIKSHNLYSYEQNIDSEIIKQCQKSNSKLYQLIDYLTGNTELTRCSFQRSDMYSTIRKDLGLDDNEKIKKKSLKVQDSKLKEMEELRNETFVRNFFNKRSMSHGYQRRQIIGTKLKHKISLTEKPKASSNLENVMKDKEIINNNNSNENNDETEIEPESMPMTRKRGMSSVVNIKHKQLFPKVNQIKSLLSHTKNNNQTYKIEYESDESKSVSSKDDIHDEILECPSDPVQENINELSIHNNSNKVANDMFNKNFDILKYKEEHGYIAVLPYIAKTIFERFDLDNMVDKTKLNSFLSAINDGYLESTVYHNAIHGADVSQTLSLYFINSTLISGLKLTSIDLISIFTASLAHDLGHPGLNNSFHINSLSNIGIEYNDISVLENYHAAQLFRIIKQEETNIYSIFSQLEFRKARKRIISMILSTDMFHHAKVFGVVRSKVDSTKDFKIELDNASPNLFDDQQDYLDFLIHLSDISHNAKPFELTSKWVDLLNQEFYYQGDKEKEMGLKVSYLCDRNNIDLPKSQIGFINAFIIPPFELLEKISKGLGFFLENARNNLKMWEKLNNEKVKEEEKKSK